MDLEPGSTARHTCHCGRSFIRKEHLTRHQATHDKPGYVCSVCQRHFTRKDLLRRHSVLHETTYIRKVVSCDACRSNKTKCSGGSRCALCKRRNIECIYRGNSRPSKVAPGAAAAASVNEEIDQDQDNGPFDGGDDGDNDGNDEEATSTISRPENSLNPELLQRNIKFLQNLTIVPSQSGTTDFPLSSHSMGGLYELLLADKPSFEEALQDCGESKARVSVYIDTYIKSFHLRWPVLLAPTLDNEIGTMPLPLAAAACLIGAWFKNGADWTERFYSLRVHETLLERLLHSLIEPELTSGEKAWPIELFQTVLLTLVFSLYRTDKSALSRAKLLRSTFITLLRDLGVLDGEKFAAHLKRHYAGIYAPYTLAMREMFKRLLVLTFQFDAFFALVNRQPPLLHLQEIGVGLPTTFALWNSYGLDVFALRELEEPHERSKVRISEIIGRSDSVTPSGILVEDVHLGLCSVLQLIWAFLQALPSSQKENPSHTFQKALLVQTLDDWKHELDKFSKLADSGNLPGNPARYLLLAYRGENDSMMASLERINSLVQDGMILYYHLRLTQYVFDIAGPGNGVVSYSNLWETSKHKKEALVCALQMLKVVESKTSFNPLIRHVLAMGVDITKASLSRQKCYLNGQHAVRNDTQHWSDIGEPFWVDGTPVCVCKLAFWIGRFEKAIQDQDIMVE